MADDSWMERIPSDVRSSFTPVQLAALQTALKPRRHTVDLRLSLPWLGKRFYLVILAGEERRSPLRRRLESQLHPLWTPGNLIILFSASALMLLSIYVIISQVFGVVLWPPTAQPTTQPTAQPSVQPAEIPWLNNQADCERTGRKWQGDRCLDFQHNPTF